MSRRLILVACASAITLAAVVVHVFVARAHMLLSSPTGAAPTTISSKIIDVEASGSIVQTGGDAIVALTQ